MIAHKYAGELKPGDAFAMASRHYRVIDVYETVDESIVKIVFTPIVYYRRFTLAIARDVLFVLL